jgi:hypothetical protein
MSSEMKRNKSKKGGKFWPFTNTAPVVPAPAPVQTEPEKPVSILENLNQVAPEPVEPASAPAQSASLFGEAPVPEPRKKWLGIFGGKSAKKRSDKKKNNKTKKTKGGKKSRKSRK